VKPLLARLEPLQFRRLDARCILKCCKSLFCRVAPLGTYRYCTRRTVDPSCWHANNEKWKRAIRPRVREARTARNYQLATGRDGTYSSLFSNTKIILCDARSIWRTMKNKSISAPNRRTVASIPQIIIRFVKKHIPFSCPRVVVSGSPNRSLIPFLRELTPLQVNMRPNRIDASSCSSSRPFHLLLRIRSVGTVG
jgi:hypothetical protein